MSLYELPQEIVSLIVWYLDKPSLVAVLRTAHFLRPHAEHLLYHKVDLHTGPMSQTRTINFLIRVVRNPRVGSLVSFFYPELVNYHIALSSTGEFVDLLPYAMRFLPNLKTLALRQADEIPKCLRWHPNQDPPFQLERLALRFVLIQDLPKCGRDVLRLLQKQPSLRHLCLGLPSYMQWGDHSPMPDAERSDVMKLFPSLEILEGTNSVVRLLFSKRRVKSLLWECDRPYREPFRLPRELETDSHLRNGFFTPELCKAYSHLEHLVIHEQISLLPILSTFLKSLKTLLLSVGVPIDDEGSDNADGSPLLRAIVEMGNLEALAITLTGESSIRLHHYTVFAAAPKLKHFAFLVGGRGQVLQMPVFMERGTDGTIYPVAREVIFDIPYLHKGWFTFGTEF